MLGRLRLERYVEPFVFETKLAGQVIDSTAGLTFNQRVQMGAEEVGAILRKIWPYLLVGIGLGAVIHGWAPEDFFTRYAGPGNAFGVLIAVAIGIPLYSNAAGILPLVEALYDKGLPMGTLLAFMMAIVALSLPEMILLRRVLKPQLLAVFVAVVGAVHHRRRLPVQRRARLSHHARKGTIMIVKSSAPAAATAATSNAPPARPSTTSGSTPPSRRSPTTRPSSATG